MTTDPFLPPASVPAAPTVTAPLAATSAPPAQTPRRGRDVPGWAVALIVVGGVGAWGGVAALSLLAVAPLVGAVEESVATATLPAPTSPAPGAAPVMEMLPPDWTRLDSTSGRLVYYIDPTWEAWPDFANVEDTGTLDGTVESVASLVADGDTEYAAAWVNIYAIHDTPTTLGIAAEAHSFIDTWVTDYDALEITSERAFTTALQYDAYEIEMDATYDGWETHDCLMTIAAGDSMVYIYASADLDSLTCTDMTRTMAQGIITR